MKLTIRKGTTSKLIQIFALDSSSTVGAGLTGLLWNTASLTGYFYREGAGSSVAITLATMTLGTWATGGFIVVDGTNMSGVYQVGIPDAALASGADSVTIVLQGAANMAPVVLEIQLVDHLGADNKVLISTDAQDLSGTLDVNTKTISTNAITAAALALDAVEEIRDSVWAKTGLTDAGVITAGGILDILLAIADGKVDRVGDVWTYKGDDDTTTKTTHTVTTAGRTVA